MAASKEVTKADVSVSLLDKKQVLTAAKSLLGHIKESAQEKTAKSGKKNLLDDMEGAEEGGAGSAADTPIWLTMTTKQHVFDSRRLQPAKIVVPHALNTDEEATICIITADPQRAYKNIVAADDFPAALRTRITRVIDLSHLQKKFKAYEAQRKLFAEHDVFVADERIINRLPGVLGKTFYKSTAKRPIPIVLRKAPAKGADGKRAKAPRKAPGSVVTGKTAAGTDERTRAMTEAAASARSAPQIATEIERAISAVLVNLSPSTNTAVRVANASWPAAHVAANVEAVVQALVGKLVPKGWSNVQALYLKGPRTMALPIWQTDALWVSGTDVLAVGSEEALAQEAKKIKAADKAAKKEKANVGKKRKALEEGEQDKEETLGAAAAAVDKAEEPETPKTGKAKGAKEGRPAKKTKRPESKDDVLDKAIAEHKAKLKKQKSAAKKALDL